MRTSLRPWKTAVLALALMLTVAACGSSKSGSSSSVEQLLELLELVIGFGARLERPGQGQTADRDGR